MDNGVDMPRREQLGINNALTIVCPNPYTLSAAMINQIGSNSMSVLLGGEEVGSVEINDPNIPLKTITTKVRGSRVSEKIEEIPDKPGYFRNVGKLITEFNIVSNFDLPNHTFLDEGKTISLMNGLKEFGYESSIETLTNGARKLYIVSSGCRFEMFIGWHDEESLTLSVQKRVLEHKENGADRHNYAFDELENIRNKKDRSYISLGLENEHPTRGPSGRKMESQEQVLKYIEESRKLTELVASLLINNFSSSNNLKKAPSLTMVWKSDKVMPVVWNEIETTGSVKDLDKVSIRKINESLVRVVLGLQKEDLTSDLITKDGINLQAKKVLIAIEEYFGTKQISSDEIEQLSERDQAYLALGLALKSLDEAVVSSDGFKFTPGMSPEIAGVTFRLYGESSRNRFGFFMQQDRKYSYNTDDSEAARFFLLHTTFSDQQDKLTRYERIQSANLENARNYIFEIEMQRMGKYSLKDVQEINRRLLKGLVPERNLGQFRRSENTKVGERIGTTEPDDIKYNLTILLDSACNFVNQKAVEDIQVSDDEVIMRLAREWASFDGIHPMEEGNGRTGTLLFESWLRLSLGRRKKFISERSETWTLADGITKALMIPGLTFRYLSDGSLIKDEDLKQLVSFIKDHITDDRSQI